MVNMRFPPMVDPIDIQGTAATASHSATGTGEQTELK
jgi:hypothetical protein